MDSDGRHTLSEKVRRLPTTSGVYIMKDSLGNVIYIGKALNLRRRVSQYFTASYKTRASNPKVSSLIDCIADFDFVNTRSEAEALILESKLIKQWKPRYNTLEKDNKNFLHLRVEMFSKLPRFTFARNRKDDGSLYFGPYLGTTALRGALNEIKKKFGILLSDARPKRLDDGRWLLYDDARGEISGFENVVSEEEYKQRVSDALAFLEDKSGEIIETATAKMREAAEAFEYEKAAKWRDLVSAVLETREANARGGVSADISRSSAYVAILAMDSLKKTLKLPREPRSIECFDISHISGSFCVASMVHFDDGEPAKNKYRRFKIKSFVGNDDFRAMKEVVGRRYSRLAEQGRGGHRQARRSCRGTVPGRSSRAMQLQEAFPCLGGPVPLSKAQQANAGSCIEWISAASYLPEAPEGNCALDPRAEALHSRSRSDHSYPWHGKARRFQKSRHGSVYPKRAVHSSRSEGDSSRPVSVCLLRNRQ